MANQVAQIQIVPAESPTPLKGLHAGANLQVTTEHIADIAIGGLEAKLRTAQGINQRKLKDARKRQAEAVADLAKAEKQAFLEHFASAPGVFKTAIEAAMGKTVVVSPMLRFDRRAQVRESNADDTFALYGLLEVQEQLVTASLQLVMPLPEALLQKMKNIAQVTEEVTSLNEEALERGRALDDMDYHLRRARASIGTAAITSMDGGKELIDKVNKDLFGGDQELLRLTSGE